MSKSREQLNDYLRGIDITDKVVLDVGVQDKPTSRLTKGTPRQYYTLDIDPQWNPDWVQDINEEANLAIQTDKNTQQWMTFDTIFAIEVLEHCWNPIGSLRNLSKWTRNGGTLYISTPFINPHHDTHDYLRYTGEWYEHVLPKLGFKDVKVTERVATTGRVQLKIFYAAEGLRVSKIRPEYGKYTYPIGYIVKATK